MGDIGGIAQAAASNVNTALTDATNVELQQRANEFNAQQAAVQRGWSAQQAAIGRDFNASQAALTREYQTGERVAAQDFSEQMSNTQIQRRMADLRQAGVNPLLAAAQLGGASSPGSSGMSGATASAPGNPGGAAASGAAAHVNADPVLGGLAQLKLTNAQAANVTQDTQNKKDQDTIISAMGDQWKVDTSPDMLFKRVQAISAQYDMDYARASEVNSVVDQIRNAASSSDLQVAGQRIQNQILGMDRDQQRATLDTTIRMQNAVNTQQGQEAENVTAAQSGLLGKTIAYAQAILTPVSSAAGAASHAGTAAKAFSTILP